MMHGVHEWRKRRTREHVIADLSVNHVEWYALLCGFVVLRIAADYGVDLWIETYNQRGEVENGQIRVQLKATDHLKLVSAGNAVVWRLTKKDLRLWLDEMMPVILIVYDAQADLAYWLYVQACFEAQTGFDLDKIGQSVTVRIPRTNVVDESAIRKFAEYRDRVLPQMKGVIHHV